MKITVINTGGTFNKRYNPLKGELEVPKDNIALDEIIESCFNIDFEIKNIISKDSLEITNEDREFLYETIKDSSNENIIIVHGTDTVDITSRFLDDKKLNKKIVLTGAMVPMSIKKVEATLNFAQAIGFLNAQIENGVYISMHGCVINHEKLSKNREIGQFLVSN
ncbi:asparaginase domain-containing protein [Arcobacter aquimarinus]|uniref:Asparaginase n=1 Tax=Arcobacter aquimarinus TaxID=1315211 RepID=A0AAE7E1E5_9BACT|nr:asparaginase domain-containing protein [Arcobacter aquimarinus]QKE25466.1 asparaginase [Arcobacter aquimarinus]RXI35884.1 asparaginase [Arcobacter aquimarinus]